jgi:hypothetical protein
MHCQINRVADHDLEYGTGKKPVAARSIASARAATRFSVTSAGEGQAFLVGSQPSPVDSVKAAAEIYGRIAAALGKHRLGIVHERIFGSLSVEPSVMAERHSALLAQGIPSGNPVTSVQLPYL